MISLHIIACFLSIFWICGFGRGTHDFIGLLDRHTSNNIPEELKTSIDENDDEVVRFVIYDCLVKLKGYWDGVEDCEDDGDWEVVVGWPDGIWIRVCHFESSLCLVL